MTWLKISDEFLEDTTVLMLKDRAYRLHVSAMVYSSRNLTDGVVTEKQMKVIQAILGYQLKRFVEELIDAGLWRVRPDGAYAIKNFLKYNPSSAEVKKGRERHAERQKEYRERAKARDASHDPQRDSGPTRPDPKEHKPRAVTNYQATAQDHESTKTTINQSLKEAS